MESPCAGGLKVSEKSLLSMLGRNRFVKKSVVSQSEQNISDALDVLADSDGDLALAAAKMGMTKSSFKRKISATTTQAESYDEAASPDAARRYLESNFGKWKVAGFNQNTGAACVEIKNGNGTIRLSVNVNLNALGRLTSGT